MAEHPDCFAYSISHTTRQPRPGELNGKDYHFVDRDEMLAAIARDDFLEHAEFSGNIRFFQESKSFISLFLSLFGTFQITVIKRVSRMNA